MPDNDTRQERMDKTLYVSDLDGTLLRSDETLSDYTCRVLSDLTGQGLHFAYATARSAVTAKKVTRGLAVQLPMIVYNGAFILDNITGAALIENYFSQDRSAALLQFLLDRQIYPLVYAYVDGRERYAFLPRKINAATRAFADSRKDSRQTPVSCKEELFAGRIFYLACIGEADKLAQAYGCLETQAQCIYQKDVYSGEQWLEILPRAATKANAVLQLKEKLGCSRVVVFGDGENDRSMFAAADECYAVANAVASLKRMATGTIGTNNEDSVAKWLAANTGLQTQIR